MPKVVRAVQLDRLKQRITGDRQRRPPAGPLVLVVVVDPGQTGSVQLTQGGRDGGRTDRAAPNGRESGGELVEALGPPSRRISRMRRAVGRSGAAGSASLARASW